MADFSHRSLSQKLGVRDGHVVAIIHPPRSFSLSTDESITVRTRAQGRADVVVAFFTTHAPLRNERDRLATMIFPGGALWIAWPKRSSKMSTDLSDVVVRNTMTGDDLVDNKVCSIDETWSALRFVWRVTSRTE